jgi:hypothetical protein
MKRSLKGKRVRYCLNDNEARVAKVILYCNTSAAFHAKKAIQCLESHDDGQTILLILTF